MEMSIKRSLRRQDPRGGDWRGQYRGSLGGKIQGVETGEVNMGDPREARSKGWRLERSIWGILGRQDPRGEDWRGQYGGSSGGKIQGVKIGEVNVGDPQDVRS